MYQNCPYMPFNLQSLSSTRTLAQAAAKRDAAGHSASAHPWVGRSDTAAAARRAATDAANAARSVGLGAAAAAAAAAAFGSKLGDGIWAGAAAVATDGAARGALLSL
jgi:hypothetical protein